MNIFQRIIQKKFQVSQKYFCIKKKQQLTKNKNQLHKKMVCENSLPLLWIYLTVIVNIMVVAGCPGNCRCIHVDVVCAGMELREIPIGIPSETRKLNLQDNQIEVISAPSLRHLTNLRTLVLSFNKITTVEDGSFENLSNLTTLNLGSNRITQLSPGIFSGLTKLNDLDLSHNKLSNIDGLLNNLMKLHRIDLSFNMVKKLTKNSFRDSTDLRFFMMPDNNISYIAPDTFRALKNLSYVSLRHNLLTDVDGVFKRNNYLTYIELSECKLPEFPKNLPTGIQYLHLSQNNISRVTKKSLKPYTKLVILILDQNQLTEIEDGALARMDDLSELWLNMNKLKELPTQLPQHLKVLQATGNLISRIRDSVFSPKSNLELLSLQSNLIEMIEGTMFQNIQKLKRLYLGGNILTVLKNRIFSDLKYLEFLSLTTTDLDFMGEEVFYGLDNLLELEMQFIKMAEEAIQGNVFKHLQNVRILDLQDSPDLAHYLLSNEDSMSSLTQLTELNLMENEITTLDKNFMQLLPHLSLIKIHDNPFHCDKRLVWFRNWINVEKDKFLIPSEIECETPSELYGMSLADVPVAQFVPTTHRSDYVDMTISKPFTMENVYLSTTENPSKVTNNRNITMVTKTESIESKPSNSSTNDNIVTSSEPKKEFTTTKSEQSQSSTRNPKPSISKPNNRKANQSGNLSDIGITAIAATATVVLICIILAIVLIILCKRQKDLIYHRAMKYEGENDVFTTAMLPPEEQIQGPPPGKYTREDRGSVTSKPGEDITNDIESKMKVYTIDDNRS